MICWLNEMNQKSKNNNKNEKLAAWPHQTFQIQNQNEDKLIYFCHLKISMDYS